MDMVALKEKVRLSRTMMVWAPHRASAEGVQAICREPRPSVWSSVPGVFGGVASSLDGYERNR